MDSITGTPPEGWRTAWNGADYYAAGRWVTDPDGKLRITWVTAPTGNALRAAIARREAELAIAAAAVAS
jgi:hypothetical protein